MIRSMTAFASGKSDNDKAGCIWEIRSVNHRYLEMFFRLPEELRALEPEFRKKVSRRLKRGKVDCFPVCRRKMAADQEIIIDVQRVESIVAASDRISGIRGTLAPCSALDLMRWPGVQVEPASNPEDVASVTLEALDITLDRLVEFRQREGRQLAAIVDDRCIRLQGLVGEIQSRIPEIRNKLGAGLRSRLDELSVEVDAARFEQEVVILIQKMDVDEELDRLRTHLDEVQRILKVEDVAGRRLDFLLQELNREANTLGSKSADSYTSAAAVEMKVLIEQMREQVQNIE